MRTRTGVWLVGGALLGIQLLGCGPPAQSTVDKRRSEFKKEFKTLESLGAKAVAEGPIGKEFIKPSELTIMDCDGYSVHKDFNTLVVHQEQLKDIANRDYSKCNGEAASKDFVFFGQKYLFQGYTLVRKNRFDTYSTIRDSTYDMNRVAETFGFLERIKYVVVIRKVDLKKPIVNSTTKKFTFGYGYGEAIVYELKSKDKVGEFRFFASQDASANNTPELNQKDTLRKAMFARIKELAPKTKFP
jgi:hypothetical protein